MRTAARRVVHRGVLLLGLGLAASGPAGAFSAGVGDDYFSAAPDVVLLDVVPGDALIAGGRVDADATIGGDATVAGGQVAVRALVGDDLHVAGGGVEVDARIGGNARVAGGNVTLTPQSEVAGSVAIAGGAVTAAGRVGRHLTVAGGEVTLGGRIEGDVRIFARTLRVLPGTRIGGELRYRTADPVALPPDVDIGGAIVEDREQPQADPQSAPDWDTGEATDRAGWVWLAGLFAVGVLLVVGLTRFSLGVSGVLRERFWTGIGVGFAVFAGMPVLVLALVLSLVGIPLALILLLAYLGMLIAAYVVGAMHLGDRLLGRTGLEAGAGTGRRLLALLAVLIGLSFLGAVPVIGDVARFAVLLLGLGGMALGLRSRAGAPPAAPVTPA